MRVLNCILCKYRNDPKGCDDILLNSQVGFVDWHCPTLSNLWYGKLIKWFPFNLIFNIQLWFLIRESGKQYNERKEEC
jgi:hypothetical protein